MDIKGLPMYKLEKMKNPKDLNKPVEVVHIYTDDEMDNKEVYRQVTPEDKKKIAEVRATREKEKKERAANEKAANEKAANEKAANEKAANEKADATAAATAAAAAAKPTAAKPTTAVNKPNVAAVNKPNALPVKPRGFVSSSTNNPVPSKPVPVPVPVPAPVIPAPAPVPPEDDTVNFYWVRHAESVANLYNNKPTDKYPENLQEPLKNEIRRFLKQDYDNVQKMRRNNPSKQAGGGIQAGGTKNQAGGATIEENAYPLVDEVYAEIDKKVEEAKEDKTKYNEYEEICKSLIEEHKKDADKTSEDYYKAIFPFEKDGKDANNVECIDKLKTNYKDNKVKPGDLEASKMYALWLQNFIPSNFLFQPTLTQCGMVQARILGEQIKDKIQPDIVISSATVRTMMTAYLTLLYAGDSIADKTIYIVPFLNEEENDAEYVFKGTKFHDYCNYAIDPEKIEDVGNKIREWFGENNRQIYDKDGTNLINIDKNTGITFEYDLYKGRSEEYRKSNINEFFTEIFNKSEVLKPKKNVLAFCHGYVINKIRDQIFDPKKDEDKNKNEALKSLKTGGKNTAVFQTNYTIGKGGEGIKNIKPIFGDTVPIEQITNDTTDPIILAKLGLIYFPANETSIRENAKEILAMDKTIAEPGIEGQEEPLISLQRGSLRGEIAFITHGGQTNPSGSMVLPADPPAPILSYVANEANFTIDVPIVENTHTPTVSTSGTNYIYTAIPPFTKGITLNATTGEISGTPTENTPNNEYVTTNITVTVTDNNTALTSKPFEFKYRVEPKPIPEEVPELEYESGKESMFQGDKYELKLNSTSVGFSDFTIDLPLPTGLALDSTNGSITGTSKNLQDSTEYTVTAKYKDANKTEKKTTIKIAVVKRDITAAYENIELSLGDPSKSVKPTGIDGVETRIKSYAFIDNPIPPEIEINAADGTITVQTNKLIQPTNYKIKITDQYDNEFESTVYIYAKPKNIIPFEYKQIYGLIEPGKTEIVEPEIPKKYEMDLDQQSDAQGSNNISRDEVKAGDTIKTYYKEFSFKNAPVTNINTINKEDGKITVDFSKPNDNPIEVTGTDHWGRTFEGVIQIRIMTEKDQEVIINYLLLQIKACYDIIKANVNNKYTQVTPTDFEQIQNKTSFDNFFKIIEDAYNTDGGIRSELKKIYSGEVQNVDDFVDKLLIVTDKYIKDEINKKKTGKDKINFKEVSQFHLQAIKNFIIKMFPNKNIDTIDIDSKLVSIPKKVEKQYARIKAAKTLKELFEVLSDKLNDVSLILSKNKDSTKYEFFGFTSEDTNTTTLRRPVTRSDVLAADEGGGSIRRRTINRRATRRLTINKRKKYTKRRRPLKGNKNKKTRRIQKKKRKFTKTKK